MASHQVDRRRSKGDAGDDPSWTESSPQDNRCDQFEPSLASRKQGIGQESLLTLELAQEKRQGQSKWHPGRRGEQELDVKVEEGCQERGGDDKESCQDQATQKEGAVAPI